MPIWSPRLSRKLGRDEIHSIQIFRDICRHWNLAYYVVPWPRDFLYGSILLARRVDSLSHSRRSPNRSESCIGGDQPRRLADYAKGTSNTILIGEAIRNPRSWADPLGGRDPRLGLNHPNGFGSPSNQKATQFVFADGSVRSINFDELHELLKD